ncbi:serine hydrolase [Maricaulis sp. W15]|uniref:serine hydrolase domain-containing protein n=1 Tax=Maricaulis sp. W15 TaxID=1772333 RepID=UPI0009FB9443|nr:serine hydrolase domain-containing protein [Maricaulis sp. W15]
MRPLTLVRLFCGLAALAWIYAVATDMRVFTGIDPEASSAEMATQLDSVLDRAMQDYSIAGVAAGALRDGEVIWSARRGQALADGTPVTGRTAFNLGSISKPATVWAVLTLARDGRIELDAPVQPYLTRFTLPESEFDASGVTLRRLLQHVAGINVHGYGGYGSHEDQPADIVELSQTFEPLEIVREPGSQPRYSGGGYVLLQMMIEDVSGQGFDAYVREHVFAPLGMDDSGFVEADLPGRSAAFNYYRREIEDLRDVASAAAGVYMSGDDMEHFLLAHLDGGGVLSETWLDQAFAPSEGSPAIGMSYTRLETPRGLLVGHGGNNSSWNARIYIRPETGDGFYFMTNATSGAQLDFDLSCTWLSAAREMPVDDVCEEALELTRQISLAAAITGVVAILVTYWLIAGIAAGRRKLSWPPRGRGPLRLTGRLVLSAFFTVAAAMSAWLFYTNSVMWRTEVIFIDEMPIDEFEHLLPAILAVLTGLALSFFSSPMRQAGPAAPDVRTR